MTNLAEAPIRADFRANGRPRVDPITDPVETATPGFSIDVSWWKMGQYIDWTDIGKKGDMRGMNAFACEVVKEWPYQYAGGPTDINSWRNLEPYDWKVAIGAVEDAAIARFQSPKETSIPR